MSNFVLSGQQAGLQLTMLNAAQNVKTDENDPSSAFVFKDSNSNVWPSVVGTWTQGVASATLTVPVVAIVESTNLSVDYLGSPFPLSPNPFAFVINPPYQGKFNLTGAVLAWDGAIYSVGTQYQMFDFSLNTRLGTYEPTFYESTGVPSNDPFPTPWFTASSQYNTGGSGITLGRNALSFNQDSQANWYSGFLLGLIDANGAAAVCQQNMSNPWGITFSAVVVRMAALDNNEHSINLLQYAFTDPTNHAGEYTRIYAELEGNSIIANVVDGTSTGFINFASEWSQAGEIAYFALTISNVAGMMTISLYLNGTLIGSITSAFEGASWQDDLAVFTGATNDGSSSHGYGLFDFMVNPSALTQPQIAAQAAAWGL